MSGSKNKLKILSNLIQATFFTVVIFPIFFPILATMIVFGYKLYGKDVSYKDQLRNLWRELKDTPRCIVAGYRSALEGGEVDFS